MLWIYDFVCSFAAQMTENVRAWWRRGIVVTVWLVFCGLVAVSGLAFIAVGSYLSLSEVVAPWAAGLIIGATLVVLSAIGSLIVRYFVLRQNAGESSGSGKSSVREADVDTIAHLGETIGASLIKNGIRTTDVMIAALVAGAVLGASPALRNRLLRRKRYPGGGPSSGSYRR